MERTELDGHSMLWVCTIEWDATSSVSRRPASMDTQPLPELATWSTAAVSAVAMLVGRKGTVKWD